MRAVLWFAGKVSLDLETYLAYHFTKVGVQTRVLIAEYFDMVRLRMSQLAPTVAL